MTRDDAARFTNDVMKPLFLMFRERPDDDLIIAYFGALADLDFGTVHRAARVAIQTLTFFPKVAELRKLAVGSVEESAARAWSRVHNAAKRGFGGYAPITFEDPALHATVAAMGGWTRFYSLGFRDTEPVDIATARKEFMELYPGYVLRGVPDGTAKELCAERGNLGRLAAKPVPAFLPDADPRPCEVEVKALPERRRDEPDFAPDFKALKADLAKRMASSALSQPPRPQRQRTGFAPVAAADIAEHEIKKAAALRERIERNIATESMA